MKVGIVGCGFVGATAHETELLHRSARVIHDVLAELGPIGQWSHYKS
jgi:hypothetical protein